VTNRELAAHLVTEADRCMARRKALLCAAVLVGDAGPRAARKILADPETRIPAGIRSAALAELDQVTTTERTAP